MVVRLFYVFIETVGTTGTTAMYPQYQFFFTNKLKTNSNKLKLFYLKTPQINPHVLFYFLLLLRYLFAAYVKIMGWPNIFFRINDNR